MQAILAELLKKALIMALIAFLSFVVQGADSLGSYGPIIGSAAAVVLSIVEKLAGRPVAKVVAKLSPRPF